jgi:hypothetical protein
MLESLLQYSYLTGLIMGSFIRAWYLRKYKLGGKESLHSVTMTK